MTGTSRNRTVPGLRVPTARTPADHGPTTGISDHVTETGALNSTCSQEFGWVCCDHPSATGMRMISGPEGSSCITW